ncbi:MAG: hypothetical protein JSS34_04180 [Proteobacteria bacterium]|nr:hypothetical protein [Pseudomonadota bacterium]
MRSQTPSKNPSKFHITYSDIDTFAYGCETCPDEFLKAVFTSPDKEHSSKLVRQKGINDMLTFEFQEEPVVSSWNKIFCMKILDYLCTSSSTNVFGLCSYFPYQYRSIVSLTQETLSSTLKDLHNKKSFSTDRIIYCTGPGLLDQFPEESVSLLTYPCVSTLTWNLLCPLKGGVVTLPYTTVRLNLLFKFYFNVLDYTFVAKKLGKDHPSFLLLRDYVEEKNPFFSEEYKESFREYFAKEYEIRSPKKRGLKKQSSPPMTKTGKKIIRKYFYCLISDDLTENYYPTYFALKLVLKEYFNIEFEVTKENLKGFLT